jgi:hypothetical protein
VPIEKVKISNPKYSIKGKIVKDYSTFVPGPGNYEPPKTTILEGPKFSFGRSTSDMAMKEKLKYVSRLYDMKSTLSKKGGVFGHKPSLPKSDEVPGPGAYASPQQKWSSKAASFGIGSKFDTSMEREAA